MTRARTQQFTAAVFIAGSALMGGTWGYYQTQVNPASELADSSPPPTYPAGFSTVQINHPPQREDGVAPQAGNAPVPTREPLSQIWEFNAQQAPEMLPQALTEPNWYIGGVVQQGDNTRVMVQFQGESQVRFYKIGDILPGGSKLAWVKPGAIGVITPKRKKLQVPILDGVQANNPGANANPGKSTR